MEKRLPVFLLLSFLVLMAWNILNPPPPEIPGEASGGGAVEQGAAQLEGFAEEIAGDEALVAESEEFIDLDWGVPGEVGSYKLRFTNRGARLLSLRLGDFSMEMESAGGENPDPETWVELLTSVESARGTTGSLSISASQSARDLLVEPLEEVLWQHRVLEGQESAGGPGIEFTYAPGTGVVFRKRLLTTGGYTMRFDFEVENASGSDLKGLKQFILTPAEVVPPHGDEAFYQEPQTLVAWTSGQGAEPKLDSEVQENTSSDTTGPFVAPNATYLAYAGVHNKFFSWLMSPSTPQMAKAVIGANYRRVKDEGWILANPTEDVDDSYRYIVNDLSLQLPVPPVGESTTLSFDVFAGPKQRQILESVNPDYGLMIDEDIGFFSSISNVITAILGFYHGLVGNWGWAIILMTLTVRALLFPLNRRAQTAMARFAKKMKRVQPMLDANKEKYAEDLKKQREEQAKIMQQEGAFPPLGGCLPMFLQFPVFIGLFQALRVHFDLRHQPFVLWMKDLSMPDQLARIDLNTHLPFIGTIEFLNILPLIMICLWIGQHKVMPQPTSNDPKQAQTRKMMMAMQVFFAFLFYNYASGLALYMITSSSVAIFESLVIKRVWPINDDEQEAKKPGRFMQKMAALQKEQQRRLELEQKRRQGGGGNSGGKRKKKR